MMYINFLLGDDSYFLLLRKMNFLGCFLECLNNGKQFHFEEQEENCGDPGASQRKGELDIH